MDIGAVTNKNIPMEWYDRFWMHSILVDQSPEMVVKKCAQIGMSTVEIFKALHTCLHRTINCIYTLPTDGDVKEFVPSKVNPIMSLNHIPLIGKSNVGQKIIGAGDEKSFLFFKGSFMERAGIMIDADYLVMDELDHCDQGTLQTFKSRIEDSPMAWLHRFSTPSAPNKRIDKEFKLGDQMHWFIKCPKCNNEWYMDWPQSEGFYIDRERKVFACAKCNAEVTDDTRRNGRWVNKWDSEGRIRSYWVSGLMKVTHRSCADLLRKEAESQAGYFYNYILGKTYSGSDANISEGMISACLSDARPEAKDMAMGVDIGGHRHHYIVGNADGIFEIGIIPFDVNDTDRGMGRVAAKMREYDIRTLVIDGNPCTNESQELAKEFPYRIYLNYFKPQEKEPVPFYYDDTVTDRYVTISDRHRVLSWTIADFQKGKIKLFFSGDIPEFTDYCNHWKNLSQQIIVKADGTEKQEWTSDGDPDHYALATVYFRMAVNRFENFIDWDEPVKTTAAATVEPDFDPEAVIMAEKVEDYDWYYGPN